MDLALEDAVVVVWCQYWGLGLRICLMRWMMWLTRGGCGPPSRIGAITSKLLPKMRNGLES
eukprot:8849761-Pyramimonas_sp.AAC.1